MQTNAKIHFFPFFSDLTSYGINTLKKDIIAALSIALLALPQSIAYSILAGLPPIAGFYSAIFGTIFCSSFCSSKHLVSGPTTAVAILLQSSIADILQDYYGNTFTSQDVMHILTHLVFMIGLIQIGAGFFNIAKLLQFISRSVILGYFAGIALAIIINQLFPLLGIFALQGDFSAFVRAYQLIIKIPTFSFATLILGLFSLGFILFFHKKFPKFPITLFVIIFASLVSLSPFFQGIEKIALDRIDHLFPIFTFPLSDFHLFIEAFPAASAIALLIIFEVFSVARAFGAKGGRNISINQEIFSVGISNFFLSFMAMAMPASGSASRSSLNFQSKGQTRFAAFFSAVFVFAVLFFAFPLISYIPITCLSAILIATVIGIIDFKQVSIALKSTPGDFLVFCLTFVSCLFFRLDIAFYIGIVISIAFYLKKAAEPHLVEYIFNTKGRLITISSKDSDYKIRIVGYAGELFFGVADFFQSTLQAIAEKSSVRVIILRLNGVYHVDASICFALLRLSEYMKATNRYLVITGVTEEVLKVFKKSSIYEEIGKENFFLTDDLKPQLSTWLGCLRAKELISSEENSIFI